MTSGAGADGASGAASAASTGDGFVAPSKHPIAPASLEAFTERLGHRFVDIELLAQALTHRSWCAEHAGYASNERLEFLGDAVLGLVVTDHLHAVLPDAGEGQMSRIRAAVVCAPALAEMGAELDLGTVLLLGKGEAASGGRSRPSILADAMEAVFGAVYVDGGLPAAAEVIGPLVEPRLVDAGAPDHKSRLHELAARDPQRRVAFELSEEGPEHDKTFRAVVVLDGVAMGEGTGRSKKQAEQAAARDTWQRLDADTGADAPREEATHG